MSGKGTGGVTGQGDSQDGSGRVGAPAPVVLARRFRRHLVRATVPSKAPAMQKYMKSVMQYSGAQTPVLRPVCNGVLHDCSLEDQKAWGSAVLTLWRSASYREERYAATHLASRAEYARHRTMRALPMIEVMIVSGAWWDSVDSIALGQLDDHIERCSGPMKKQMLTRSTSMDTWKRRSAILCQLHRKERTVFELPHGAIELSLEEREFVLRTDIGWALRQYAWTDPQEVVRSVSSKRYRMSRLSEREALKNAVGDTTKS